MTATAPIGRRVVVVGAGIGGLAAATGLHKVGWDPTVLERSASAAGVGAGVSLWSNALTALDRLGVGEPIRAAGALEGGGGLRKPDGRWLSRSSAEALNDRAGVSLLMIHRARLHGELLAALPGGTVRTGTVVTHVRERGDEAVVGYDGPDGAGELTADLVIGADGLHSTVRGLMWPAAPAPSYAGFTAWRGITDRPQDITGEAAETWGEGAEFGAAPLPDGRVYWFGTATLPAGTRFADEHAEALRRFGQWHSTVPAVLRATSPAGVLRHDVYHHLRPLPQFVRGRLVLLGDAAHAMTPNLGQGACLALEDAVELAAALSTADGDIAGALYAYDHRRRPRGERIIKLSAQLGRMIQTSGRARVALRDLLVRATPERMAMASLARVTAWTAPTIDPPREEPSAR